MRLGTAATAVLFSATGMAFGADCGALTAAYSKFDAAMLVFDRTSKSESSALRAETAQSAITNILLRQGIIIDMMITQDCDLPDPPDFQILGLIASHN